jgi:hypothetical protein
VTFLISGVPTVIPSEQALVRARTNFRDASDGSVSGGAATALAKPSEMNIYTKIGGGGTQVRINRNLAHGHFVMRYTTIEAMVTTEKLWR